MSDVEDKDTGLPWVVTAGAIGVVALGAYYLGLRCAYGVHSLADHANLGNALAPVVAFLTLLAVISALWSVQIQRTELALQRQELRETRDEMVEQRKQFEKTASAQQRLADSQELLAHAQVAANTLALAAHISQLEGFILDLDLAAGEIEARGADLASRGPAMGNGFAQVIAPTLDRMSRARALLETKVAILREMSTPKKTEAAKAQPAAEG